MNSMASLPRSLSVLVATLLLAGLGGAQWKNAPLQAPAHPNMQLYREDANAAQEISEATAQARKGNKRVLLVFGGNWCFDCHVLDNAFHQPRIAPLLEIGFIVVHVDVGRFTKNLDLAKKYRINLEKGVPAMAVLNSRGGFLYSTSEFEKARVKTQDDLVSLLNAWMPVATSKQ
jgi:thiol:disulfide interchange protein